MNEDFKSPSYSKKGYISEEKVICYQLELGNKFADVLTQCFNCYPVESEEVRTNAAIYSHALLGIHITGGQRLVRIAPPSLSPDHSDPTTSNFQSSISVEVLL